MAERTPYPRSDWISEIPFDVSDWGDVPDPWPDGLFRSKAEYDRAVVESSKLPKTPPTPKRE